MANVWCEIILALLAACVGLAIVIVECLVIKEESEGTPGAFLLLHRIVAIKGEGRILFALILWFSISTNYFSTLFGTCSFLHNVLLIIISFIKWSSYVAIYVLNGLYSCALFDLITNTSFWNHWCLHQVEWTWLLKSWLVYSNQLKGLRFGSRYTTHDLLHYWYMMLTVWHHLYIFVFYDQTSN